ncbi:hypothetical protein KI387_010461, partial [Taxus chinensis]
GFQRFSFTFRFKSERLWCFFKMEMAAALENPISSGDFFKWGIRKRMRCGKPQVAEPHELKKSTLCIDRRVVGAGKEASATAAAAAITIPSQEQRLQVKSGLHTKVQLPCNNSFHFLPPLAERSTRSQHTVNNLMCTRSRNNTDETKTIQDNKALNLEPLVWPKICLGLSLTEKEEDFLAIKGSKLPLRPKKTPQVHSKDNQ